MNEIFTIKKTYTCIDEDMIPVYLPFTVKVSISNLSDKEKNELIPTIENMVEYSIRLNTCQINFENICRYTFRFIKDIYNSLRDDLILINCDVIDIYVGDEKITCNK